MRNLPNFRKGIIKKVSFKELPAEIQGLFNDSLRYRHGESVQEDIRKEMERHEAAMKRLAQDVENGKKYLNCKHEEIEHEIKGPLTDNMVTCKICGFGWSDY